MVRPVWLVAPLVALAVGGCGGAGMPPDGEVHLLVPANASRPAAPDGPVLVKLERLDGTFGRHDTLIVARSGAASMQLAHGGGGFRQQACALDAGALRGLQDDLKALPIDGPRRRVRGYVDAPHDGVVIARPPVYAVTYRGRMQVFGGATMPTDGAPLAARLERILTAHEGRCRTTFHRP
ncbi:MAG TPA: hypothetical protein VI318_25820 [Baekduia sp.]